MEMVSTSVGTFLRKRFLILNIVVFKRMVFKIFVTCPW
jgi:hypothetical protein